VFSVGLGVLGNGSVVRAHPDFSWTDLYISLAIMDMSTPRIPLGLLAIVWKTSVDVAESICMRFSTMALGRMKAGSCRAAGVFEMHD
jgi:hypothetical protein